MIFRSETDLDLKSVSKLNMIYYFGQKYLTTQHFPIENNTILARIRLLGRFTTCIAQTTTASRLLFALGWHFISREWDFLEIFEFKN